MLFGIDQPSAGRIRIDGEDVSFADPAAAMARGRRLCFGRPARPEPGAWTFPSSPTPRCRLSERRRWLALSCAGGNLRWSSRICAACACKFRSFDQPVKTLSGGNQQKVVLSKWLATIPRVLILDEPTQGIDVQSKAEVHAMIAELAQQGLAIILISSELPELVGMCDRIVVLREGRVTARLFGRRRGSGAGYSRRDRCGPRADRRQALTRSQRRSPRVSTSKAPRSSQAQYAVRFAACIGFVRKREVRPRLRHGRGRVCR